MFTFPNLADRYQILKAQTANMAFMPGHEPPLEDLAERTSRWTAADLGHIWTEAGILAALDGRDRMCLEDVYGALPLVDRGPHRTEETAGNSAQLA